MTKKTPIQKAKRTARAVKLEKLVNKKRRELKRIDKAYKETVRLAANKIIRLQKRKLKKGK